MGNIEIDVNMLLEKLKKRISDDAQSIAMYEATIDVLNSRLLEYDRELANVRAELELYQK